MGLAADLGGAASSIAEYGIIKLSDGIKQVINYIDNTNTFFKFYDVNKKIPDNVTLPGPVIY